MAIERLHQTGFETDTTLEHGNENTIFNLDTPIINTTSLVHTGAYSLNNSESPITVGNFNNIHQISINYFMRFEIMETGTTFGKLWGIKSSNSYYLEVTYNDSTKEIKISDSNSVIYGNPVPSFITPFINNSWMAIGITAKCGSGGWISLYIDGIKVITHSANFFDSSSLNGFVCGGTPGLFSSTNLITDDITINKCTADEPDVAPHSPIYYPLRPNSRGFNTEWAGIGNDDNFNCVATLNDDTDSIPYVFAEYNNLKDLYGFPAPPTNRIIAMIPTVLAHGGGSLFGTEIQLLSSDSINEDVGTLQEVGYALDILWERFVVAPNGDDWTPGNAGETNFGFKSTIRLQLDLVATTISDTEIGLTWNDIETTEDGYSIERSLTGLTGWVEIAVVAANSTSYSDTDVDPDTQYFYRVRGFRYA